MYETLHQKPLPSRKKKKIKSNPSSKFRLKQITDCNIKRLMSSGQGMVAQVFNSQHLGGRERQVDLYGLEATVVYLACSRPAKATQWEPVSKTKQTNKRQKQKNQIKFVMPKDYRSRSGCCFHLSPDQYQEVV